MVAWANMGRASDLAATVDSLLPSSHESDGDTNKDIQARVVLDKKVHYRANILLKRCASVLVMGGQGTRIHTTVETISSRRRYESDNKNTEPSRAPLREASSSSSSFSSSPCENRRVLVVDRRRELVELDDEPVLYPVRQHFSSENHGEDDRKLHREKKQINRNTKKTYSSETNKQKSTTL